MSRPCPFTFFVAGAAAVALPLMLSTWMKNGDYTTRIPRELKGKLYSKELEIAIKAAVAGGKNMTESLENASLASGLEYKKGPTDFATECDRKNEAQVLGMLSHYFKGDAFIGEETSADDGQIPALTSDRTWICDPIDGTTNFVHRFPLSCVSIALYVDKQPVVGVAYCPAFKELFVAMRGHGTFLNGKRVWCSEARTLKGSLTLWEPGYSRESAHIDRWLVTTRTVLLEGVHAMRTMGSGVLDLAYVAAGRLDCLYSGVAGEGWCPWDYAAGALMVQEAGGSIKAIDGSSFDLYGTGVVACATEELAVDVVRVLAKADSLEYVLNEHVMRRGSKTGK
jgi:fructose-1,6-bisphosphatase/inositol monophosphatase family enzyme